MGRSIPLLPVPAGTENLLCKAIGVPADAETIRTILDTRRTPARWPCRHRSCAFAVMSGIGFDATVTQEVHAKRHGPISRWWYFWPTLKNLLAYKWPHMDVEVDGEALPKSNAEDAATIAAALRANVPQGQVA